MTIYIGHFELLPHSLSLPILSIHPLSSNTQHIYNLLLFSFAQVTAAEPIVGPAPPCHDEFLAFRHSFLSAYEILMPLLRRIVFTAARYRQTSVRLQAHDSADPTRFLGDIGIYARALQLLTLFVHELPRADTLSRAQSVSSTALTAAPAPAYLPDEPIDLTASFVRFLLEPEEVVAKVPPQQSATFPGLSQKSSTGAPESGIVGDVTGVSRLCLMKALLDMAAILRKDTSETRIYFATQW